MTKQNEVVRLLFSIPIVSKTSAELVLRNKFSDYHLQCVQVRLYMELTNGCMFQVDFIGNEQEIIATAKEFRWSIPLISNFTIKGKDDILIQLGDITTSSFPDMNWVRYSCFANAQQRYPFLESFLLFEAGEDPIALIHEKIGLYQQNGLVYYKELTPYIKVLYRELFTSSEDIVFVEEEDLPSKTPDFLMTQIEEHALSIAFENTLTVYANLLCEVNVAGVLWEKEVLKRETLLTQYFQKGESIQWSYKDFDGSGTVEGEVVYVQNNFLIMEDQEHTQYYFEEATNLQKVTIQGGRI